MMRYEIEVEHATGRARVLEAAMRIRRGPDMPPVPLYTASRWYDTQSEAVALEAWLNERAAGYPPNPTLVNYPIWK